MDLESAGRRPASELPDGDTHATYTVSPRTETLIRLRTLPNAVCRIRLDDRNEKSSAAIASPAGYLDLYSTHTAEGETRRISVEAETATITAEHVIDVRCAQSPTSDAPSPVADRWPSSPDDIHLPALSKEERRELDAAELAARGYPRRPNRDTAPASYRQWSQLVSQSLTVVAPSHIANPDYPHRRRVKHTGVAVDPRQIHPEDVQMQNTTNWCGAELLYLDGRSFDGVEASWTVPNVSLTDAPSGSADLAIWVGLDGDGTTDLLQGGTLHSVTQNSGHTVVTHQAWSELLPNQPFLVVMNNFSVAPGNQVQCTVERVDASNAASPTGVNGLADVVNVTSVTMGRAITPLHGTNVTGRMAEWIAERTSGAAGVPGWLATFPYITFSGAYAVPSDISQPNLPWYTPNAAGITTMYDTMYNSANQLLACPLVLPNGDLAAEWKQSH